MRIAMINGSPKNKDSASGELLKELQSSFTNGAITEEFCFNKAEIDDAALLKLMDCDIWVFAFPLYVDGVPSQLLSCLCQIEKTDVVNKNIMVFGIVNCGFYEGKQNSIALEILKNWCDKLGLQWGIGVGIGGGGGLAQMKSVPFGKGTKTSLGKAFCSLKDKIENKKTGDNIYISIDFPRWLYKICAEMGWMQMIKKNGGKVKDLNYRY